MKNYKDRPKYKKLLQHQFILKYEQESVDVGAWYKSTQVGLHTFPYIRKLVSVVWKSVNL